MRGLGSQRSGSTVIRSSHGTQPLPTRGGVWHARSVPPPARPFGTAALCLAVQPVGKPDAGNPHVRFDGRGRETERPLPLPRSSPPLPDPGLLPPRADYRGRCEKVDQAILRASGVSPRDPFSVIYTGTAAYAQFCQTQLRGGRCGWRARPSASSKITSAPTGPSHRGGYRRIGRYRGGRTPGASPHATRNLVHLDRDRNAHHAERRIGALFGSLPPRSVGPALAPTGSPQFCEAILHCSTHTRPGL